jgi:hypothetical protein
MTLIKVLFSALFWTMLLSFHKASAQDTIYWQPDYKLTWEDFQGSPDTISKYRAISNSGIKYHLSINEGSFSTKVSCYFIKTKSWARIKNSDILLAHEQGHFDIAELFARKLRKAFAGYKFNHQTVSSDFNFLFNTNEFERDKVDALYDKETNLSQNRDQQLLWNKKIKTDLDSLKKYASP